MYSCMHLVCKAACTLYVESHASCEDHVLQVPHVVAQADRLGASADLPVP